jgi:hypothetical protein
MKIFAHELKDGLSDAILSNKTIAIDCSLSKLDDEKILSRATAKVGEGRDFDIYNLSAVLASVGVNANDDTFLAEELWAARNTPINKQFNYNHNEKDVIGCIYDSFLLDSAGNLVDTEDKIDTIQDICTYSAIWTKWGDSDLQTRMDLILAAIDNNELYVSMEALFKNFDYLLVGSDNTNKVVQRTEASSFLTKHLRSFGGNGTFEDYQVKRVLRDFTFSGKGLVANPANKRSVIDPNIIVISKGSNNNEGTFNMSDILEKQIAELHAKLAVAEQANESLKAAQAAEKENLVSAEIEKLNQTIADLKTQNSELTALAEKSAEDMKKMREDAEKAKSALEAEVAAKAEAIAKMEQEKVVAERVAKLVQAGQTAEKAAEICEVWASVDDAKFLTLVDLYKVSTAEYMDKKDKEDEEDETSASEDFEDVTDKTKATAGLSFGGDKDAETRLKAIAEQMKKTLFNKEQ